MENKCEKCFYYKLCVQHDYVIEEETEITNNYCGIHEEGIPSKIWNSEETCEDFIEDEEPDNINLNSPNIEDKTTLNN